MDFAQAFLYPFNDTDWLKKIGLIALISLIPVLGQIVAVGWMVEATRRAAQHDPVLLPELNFEKQFMLGLKGFVAGLGYALPIILLTIPFIFLTISASSQENQTSLAGTELASLCFTGVMFLYGLVLTVIMPAAYGNLAMKDKVGAAFDFKTIFRLIRVAPMAYLMAIIGTLAASFIAGLGMFVCIIGVIFTNAYYMAIIGNLYGQAYTAAVSGEKEVRL